MQRESIVRPDQKPDDLGAIAALLTGSMALLRAELHRAANLAELRTERDDEVIRVVKAQGAIIAECTLSLRLVAALLSSLIAKVRERRTPPKRGRRRGRRR